MDFIQCQGKCNSELSCLRSWLIFKIIWYSGGSALRSANKEFPTLHNHRFPLGKWMFMASKFISPAACSSSPWRASLFSWCPKTTSPHRTRLPSHFPCLSSLSLFSRPSPLCWSHSILPCSAPQNQRQTSSNLPVDVALVCTGCL